ncbi:unnamed protein product [Microthlaspi erraticum]|uniref:Uncharacterized protein n=1 Tax=Microthlaspi erraticum TaxID=1685480 RepID=A0A6D2K6H7_9BRAS|nr:unnamed protein product [Microthlaspi erraticum]
MKRENDKFTPVFFILHVRFSDPNSVVCHAVPSQPEVKRIGSIQFQILSAENLRNISEMITAALDGLDQCKMQMDLWRQMSMNLIYTFLAHSFPSSRVRT